MFKYEYPVFEHKNILKKAMLDELRDYPLSISRMLLSECGDGILMGCEISWDKEVLTVQPGLLHYGGHIYRMEEPYEVECRPADSLTYIKVRFVTMDYERDHMGGLGEIILSEDAPEGEELELGRFRLQEGARLRTVYENFEDYQTEYDTVNRIHVPYAQADGAGLWHKLLTDYATELLATGTEDAFDISFAMQLLGTQGRVAGGLVKWYVEKASGRRLADAGNEAVYTGLLRILKERRAGGSGWKRQEPLTKQMILL